MSANWAIICLNGTKTVDRYSTVVPLSASNQPFTVFSTVSFSSALTKAELETLQDKDIIIKAYAHQQVGVAQLDADAAALAHFGVTP